MTYALIDTSNIAFKAYPYYGKWFDRKQREDGRGLDELELLLDA